MPPPDLLYASFKNIQVNYWNINSKLFSHFQSFCFKVADCKIIGLVISKRIITKALFSTCASFKKGFCSCSKHLGQSRGGKIWFQEGISSSTTLMWMIPFLCKYTTLPYPRMQHLLELFLKDQICLIKWIEYASTKSKFAPRSKKYKP